MKRYLDEVERALKRSRPKNDPDYIAFRANTSKLKILGHRLPLMQQLVKKGFSFYAKSPDEVLHIWDHIWKTSSYHEAMSLPLFYYRHYKKSLGKREWKVMKHWIDRIENWEHSDALSQLYSHLFENHPSLVEPTLQAWNRSKNRWKQRASIVSLIYYASAKRVIPPVQLILELVEPLIKEKDMYVAKAVGWTLREAYNLYPKETLAFIEKQVGSLAPDAFSYSTEKVHYKTKDKLKQLRSLAREK